MKPAVLAVFFFGAYMLLAGPPSWSEALMGVPCALFATVALLHWGGPASRPFRYRAPWWRVIASPLAALVTDTGRVGMRLLQSLARRPDSRMGGVLVQPFDHGGNAPEAAARRGIVTLAVSLAPNAYVLDVPDQGGSLVLHQLQPGTANPDRAWPL